ncbi:rhamnogalacturonan lyase family protein [Streptomyces sp. HD]|uniref:rhamnogalacturonan lyase family protein n=1 Tax=Streptomyces sp. HD TaxID=3020892 RepID=UPI003FA6F85A
MRNHSTPQETSTKITTLLQDTKYRTAPARQNSGYNQPPHPGSPISNEIQMRGPRETFSRRKKNSG